jgi:hypothetical protein
MSYVAPTTQIITTAMLVSLKVGISKYGIRVFSHVTISGFMKIKQLVKSFLDVGEEDIKQIQNTIHLTMVCCGVYLTLTKF